MSVIPLRPVPASVPATPAKTSPRPLRLVVAHDHAWELRSVEYEDAIEVRRYECARCPEVMFR